MARPSKRRRQDLTPESTPERKDSVPVTRPATPSVTRPGTVPVTRPAAPSATRPGTVPATRPGAPSTTPSGAPSAARPGIQGTAGRTSPPAPAPRRGAAPPARRGATSPGSGGNRYRTQRVAVPRPWWQQPWAWGGAVTVVVVAVVVVFLLVGHSSPSKSGTSSSANPLAPASVLNAVTGVSPTVSSAIGAGGVTDPLQPLSGSPAQLTGPNGHPELFYLGAEYCPYCAAERWSVVIALSRFGKFSNLHITTSDSNPDDIPNTHTFTFLGSSYSSQYLDFAPIESEDRSGNPLQTPTAAQQALINAYDTSPYSSTTGGIPFQDLANRYILSGAGVNPEILQGMDWQQIADTLSNSQSQVAQAIIGNANWITAGICKVTGNQPGSVCNGAPISTLEAQIASS